MGIVRRHDLYAVGDHASGFGMLQKPGDKGPFIEISLQKSLAGLLPGLGLLTLAVPFSFLGLQRQDHQGSGDRQGDDKPDAHDYASDPPHWWERN